MQEKGRNFCCIIICTVAKLLFCEFLDFPHGNLLRKSANCEKYVRHTYIHTYIHNKYEVKCELLLHIRR